MGTQSTQDRLSVISFHSYFSLFIFSCNDTLACDSLPWVWHPPGYALDDCLLSHPGPDAWLRPQVSHGGSALHTELHVSRDHVVEANDDLALVSGSVRQSHVGDPAMEKGMQASESNDKND